MRERRRARLPGPSTTQALLAIAGVGGGVAISETLAAGIWHEVGIGLIGAGVGMLLGWLPLRSQETRARRQGEQLTALQQGSARTERSLAMQRLGVGTDHDGVQLSGLTLNAVRMPRHSFRDAHLDDATFSPVSDLSEAVFTGAQMERVVMADAILCGAQFAPCQANGAVFSRAWLLGASFAGANIGCSDFRGARLGGANLCGAYLRGAKFDGLREPNGGNFAGADVRESSWRGADMENACFLGAVFCDGGHEQRGADFSGSCNYVGTDFRYAILDNCVFADIEPSSFDWAFADIEPSSLDFDAREFGAPTFHHARLFGTDFRGCEPLWRWSLRDAMANQSTQWPDGFDAEKHGVLMAHKIARDDFFAWMADRAEAHTRARQDCLKRT